MPGTLQDLAEFEADLEARDVREITKQDLLDLMYSTAQISGSMQVSAGVSPAQDITGDGNYNVIDVFEASRDTKGVADDIPNASYLLKANAGGDWTASAIVRFTATDAGTYRLRLSIYEVVNDLVNPSFYRDQVTVAAGEVGHLAIGNSLFKGLVPGDKILLELRAGNNDVITITFAQFYVSR